MSFNIELLKGDITKAPVYAIVNAANQSMLGGGGVDGAIHAAAGPELMRTCVALRACPAYMRGLETGAVAVAPGFNLHARYVILTVGPIYHGLTTTESVDDARELLKLCYLNSILAAERLDAKTIAFPSISTGVYGWPVEDAADAALRELSTIANNIRRSGQPSSLKTVYFYLFDDDTYNAYSNALNGL